MNSIEPLLRWYRTVAFQFRYMTAYEIAWEIVGILWDYLVAIWYWGIEMTRCWSFPQQTTTIHPRDLPELVEKQNQTHVVTPSVAAVVTPNRSRLRPGGLEPAFRSREDYPEGWMVYHHALGVVSKDIADRYEERLKEKNRDEMEYEEKKQESQDELMSSVKTSENTNKDNHSRLGGEKSEEQEKVTRYEHGAVTHSESTSNHTASEDGDVDVSFSP